MITACQCCHRGRAARWATGIFCGALSSLLAVDWPQYRGSGCDGVTPEPILATWPANGPRQLWKVASLTNGFSTFAVSGERAFTQIRRHEPGQSNELCVAVDIRSGTELWATKVGLAYYPQTGAGQDDGPRSTPAVQAGRVFVTTTYLSLLCLEATTGSVVWSNNVLAAYGGRLIPWQNAASPTVDEDLVFVSSCATRAALLAFRTANGALAWRSQDEKMTHATPAVVTLHGVRQVLYPTQSGYVSLVRDTGELLWKYPYPFTAPPSLAVSPVVHQDIVFCSAGYNKGSAAARIDYANGVFTPVPLWANPGLVSSWMTPVCHQGYLYGLFSEADPGGPLKCIELATGLQRWSVHGFGAGGTVLAGGYLLVLAENGRLVLARPVPSAYSEVARRQPLTGKCWNHPVVAGGRLYARSTSEAVCLEIAAPRLRMLAPEPAGSNRFHLTITTTDGSAIGTDRVSRIGILGGADLRSGPAAWSPLTNKSVLTNGLLRMSYVEGESSRSGHFIAVERP
jgi:outer membrane protein assembly factor BamB